jgi:hypothetical protein
MPRLLSYMIWEMIRLLLVLVSKPTTMHTELLVMEMMHKEQVPVMELMLMVDLVRKCYRMLLGSKMSMLRPKLLLVMWGEVVEESKKNAAANHQV